MKDGERYRQKQDGERYRQKQADTGSDRWRNTVTDEGVIQRQIEIDTGSVRRKEIQRVTHIQK